jgi:hypothetical protein
VAACATDLAIFGLNRLRPRAEREDSGFAVVTECRPAPIRSQAQHHLAAANQSIWASVITDATCLIQPASAADRCLRFSAPSQPGIAVLPPQSVDRDRTSLRACGLVGSALGKCSAKVRTNVSFIISDEPAPAPDEPFQHVAIEVEYVVTVR